MSGFAAPFDLVFHFHVRFGFDERRPRISGRSLSFFASSENDLSAAVARYSFVLVL